MYINLAANNISSAPCWYELLPGSRWNRAQEMKSSIVFGTQIGTLFVGNDLRLMHSFVRIRLGSWRVPFGSSILNKWIQVFVCNFYPAQHRKDAI